MKGHLTSDQFAAHVSGFADSAADQHLSECAECRAEVARAEAALTGFRSVMNDWSHRTMPAGAMRAPVRNASWFTNFRAIAAVVMLTVAVLAGLLLNRTENMKPHQPAISDAALLDQIDRQMSRQVPAHLEPLLETADNGGQ